MRVVSEIGPMLRFWEMTTPRATHPRPKRYQLLSASRGRVPGPGLGRSALLIVKETPVEADFTRCG